jgi:hypothetical protein
LDLTAQQAGGYGNPSHIQQVDKVCEAAQVGIVFPRHLPIDAIIPKSRRQQTFRKNFNTVAAIVPTVLIAALAEADLAAELTQCREVIDNLQACWCA